jgi:hypothetical protein
MKTFARNLVVALVSLLIAACESISARSDYDHSFDFTGYHTFSWISEKPMIVASPEVSPLAQGRIQKAITQTLATKGIRYVPDPANADFVIAFTVGSRQQVSVSSASAYPYPIGYVGPHGWGSPYYQDIDVREYTQGRLAVDVFDVKLKQPVWTGIATKNITGSDQANPKELVEKAVAEILKDFPPGRAP